MIAIADSLSRLWDAGTERRQDMRIIYTALLATFMATPALAISEDDREICTSFSELAETIMTKRQSGAAMSDMMNIAAGDSAVAKVAEAMVIDAFNYPKFSSYSYQVQAAEKFANTTYLACITTR